MRDNEVNLIDDKECKYKDSNSYSWKTSAIFLFPSLAFSYFSQILEVSNIIVCLFDLILYVPSTIFQLSRDGSSLVEPVLS